MRKLSLNEMEQVNGGRCYRRTVVLTSRQYLVVRCGHVIKRISPKRRGRIRI